MGLTPSRPAVPAQASVAQLAAHWSLSAHWVSTEPVLPMSNQTLTVDYLREGWRAQRLKTARYATWTPDPFDPYNSEAVLRIEYPTHSRLGEQFAMRGLPMITEGNVETALLKYEVAFDPDFDFVKGGKLPGLYGSAPGASALCAGGKHRQDCFSARLMWRQEGKGEVYAYIPTYAGFCELGEQRGTIACDKAYGTSLSRGSFRFSRGGWTTITQLVALNTPGVANGVLHLYVNDTLALSHSNVLWRTDPSVTLTSILFSTFYGGGDDSYNARGPARSYFRKFEVYGSSKASAGPGRAVTAIWGDPWPPSRRRAATISRSLVYFTCATIIISPYLHWMTS